MFNKHVIVIFKTLVQCGQARPTGLTGPLGTKGIGFNLTASRDYDMKTDKKIYFLDTPDDHKVDGDYNTIVQHLKSAVNKEYLNDKFLRKYKDGILILI